MCPKVVHIYYVVVSLLIVELSAQPVHSPYTAQEVGEFIENTLPHHAAMGHVGVALPQLNHIQALQPALLAQAKLTRIYLGLASDIRQVRSQSTRLNYNSIKLGAVLLSFPIKTSQWGLRIGVSPHTETNYNVYLSGLSAGKEGSISNHSLSGKGGINKAQISNGLYLGKGLYVGAELSYYFGSIHKTDRTQIVSNDASGIGVEIDDRYSFNGIGYTLALYYRYELSNLRKIHIGTTLTPSSNLSRIKATQILRFRSINGLPIGSPMRTLLLKDRYILPLEARLGLGYQVGSRWSIGLDAQIRSFSSSNYRNSLRLATGLSFTPESRSLSYFKRLPYRFGVSWEKIPYRVESTQLQDISIYFGSAVLLRGSGQIDVGLRFGSRGEATQSTFLERYVQIYTGTTFSSKWFVKRKYD